MLKSLFLVMLGASCGVALGAGALHTVTAIRTRHWFPHIGYILVKLGWVTLMTPLAKVVIDSPMLQSTGLFWLFETGTLLAALGFFLVAVDTRRGTARLSVASRLYALEQKLKAQGLRITAEEQRNVVIEAAAEETRGRITAEEEHSSRHGESRESEHTGKSGGVSDV